MQNPAHTHSHQTMTKVVLMVALLHIIVVYLIAHGFAKAPMILPTPMEANATKPIAVRIHASSPTVQYNPQPKTQPPQQRKVVQKTKPKELIDTALTAKPKQLNEPAIIESDSTIALADGADNPNNSNVATETQLEPESSDSNAWDALLPPPIFLPQSHAQHLNNPQPEYPNLSRKLREQGRVLLDVYINIHGDVTDVRIRQSSGYPRLDEAALTAVKAWHYIPARQGKSPIALWHVQPISFVLN